MKRIGMSRFRRTIFATEMWQQRVQTNQAPLLYFERLKIIERPGYIVDNFESGSSAGGAYEAGLQAKLVPARNGPQATVLNCRIFKREPKTEHLERLCVKKSCV